MNTKLNKSDFLILSSYFIVSFILQGKGYLDRGALVREYFIDFPVEIISVTSIIFLFTFWLIPKVVAQKKYILFLVYGLLILIFITGIDYVIGFWSGANNWDKFPKGINLILLLISLGTQQAAFPFALFLAKKFYEGQTEYLKIEKQQKENELKLLRSQIDPHFLFNNLNTLDSLIDSNPEKAKEYINRLSLIYRYLIKTKDAEVMELSSEVEFAKNYIFLINTRFGDDYEFTIEENTSLVDKFIPTGAIQTLLENVVKHNKSDGNNPIITTIKINDGWLIITNSKSKINSKEESFGTGLENLKTRYKLLSDEKIKITDIETKFEAFIPIIKLSN
ncbi:sensor histidine kinase [Polaribacter sp. Q13]|uniref:sensor histidine kinase n=1 Tax=Polaribacter sp. Q13 TaxID=2806551 RepID=UPI00193C55F0|nr:histidine kinase [Polaribacter sp. Q13]QVY64144.1 histidine kinase [Polaribacter sp. Q13]